VLQLLVDQVSELLNADAADCYLYDSSRALLRCAAVHGLDSAIVGFEFPADRGLAGAAVQQGAPIVSNTYSAIAEPVPHPAYRDFTEAVVAPMVWSGETRGVLGVGTRDPHRPFESADIDLLTGFASLASLALRNAEIFEE